MYGYSAFQGLQLGVDQDLQDFVVLHLDLVHQVHISTRYDLCFSALHLNQLYNPIIQPEPTRKIQPYPHIGQSRPIKISLRHPSIQSWFHDVPIHIHRTEWSHHK